MTSLATTYLGLPLAHPVVASASPLSGTLEGVRRLAGAGVSAVVLESLFQEQVELEFQLLVHLLGGQSRSYKEALTAFSDRQIDRHRPGEYLRLIERARSSVDVPIIASLNGVTPNGWLEYGAQCAAAGASALELNLYYLATNPAVSAVKVERRLLRVVSMLCSKVTVPVAVKLSPFFTSLPHLARRLVGCGAQGVVLFNRMQQPDIDIGRISLVPRARWSDSSELLIPLTWTQMLRGRVSVDVAITGGVHTGADLIKSMLAGARVVMIATRFLKQGPETVVPELLHSLRSWMREKKLATLDEVRNSLDAGSARAGYMKTIQSVGEEPA